MTHNKSLVLAALLGLAPACVGQVTEQGGGDDVDAAVDTPDADPGADASPVAAYDVSGVTQDYSSLDPLPTIALATEGMTPPMQTESDALGAYSLKSVPAGAFIIRAMPAGVSYVPTTNPAISVLDQAVTQNVYVASAPFVQRQYATAGITMTGKTSLVVFDLQNLDGSAWVNVPMADITLVDMAGAPVPGITGPYFIGANGDIDKALLVSTAFGLRARAAFLNVPTGTWTIKVNTPGPAVGEVQKAAAIAITYDDGATLSRVIHDPAADAGGTPKFTTDIYPILQKASKGGQDCASCHNATGTAALLIMDDGAAATLARLKATLGVIDLATPANSLLLTKPLYEDPPNHPNATWLDITNPYYVKILLWIAGGAPE